MRSTSTNIEVQDQAEFREMYATFLNQVLNLVTALLLFAMIIALFGVMNTLYLSIYERTRELGLLRAVGLTRRQTRSMVRWEAVIISIAGRAARRGDRDRVRLGVAAGARTRGVQRARHPGGQLVIYVVFAAVLGVVRSSRPGARPG